MLIENQTRWNTEDLERITSIVLDYFGFTDLPEVLVFGTHRGSCSKHFAGHTDWYRGVSSGCYGNSGLRFVVIKSPEAAPKATTLQHISSGSPVDKEGMQSLVSAIRNALKYKPGHVSYKDEPIDWSTFPLNKMGMLRIERSVGFSPSLEKKTLEGIQKWKAKIQRDYEDKIRRLDRKIALVEKRIARYENGRVERKIERKAVEAKV